VSSDEIDWEAEEKARVVFATAQAQVGDARYGGSWIDRTSAVRPQLEVAVVAPTPDDVRLIEQTALAAGWRVIIDAVTYSRSQLISFYEDLVPPTTGAVSGLGWDAQLNRVVVRLTRPDEAESFFRGRIAADALLLRYVGDEPATALPD
jgi:hypothetical protein